MKKNILGAAIGAGLLLATIAPAFAADVCNTTTGPNSTNLCTRFATKTLSLSLKNKFSKITNKVTTNTTTGGNNQNGNTNGGGTTAGGAVAGVDVATSLNTANVGVDQTANSTCDNCTGLSANNITGPSSNNQVTINTSRDATINVSNNGTVDNHVKTTANSGYNNQNGNTVAGNITTGNASATVNVTTLMNDTVITITQ